MPLLYLSKLVAVGACRAAKATSPRRSTAPSRVLLSRQDSAGSFGLWSADGADDIWLDAFVSDFLTRARENKYAVPQQRDGSGARPAAQLCRQRHRRSIPAIAPPLAYAIYVLARNGRPVIGDLRYLADARLDAFDTPLARAQLAAALSLLGDRGTRRKSLRRRRQVAAKSQGARLSRAPISVRCCATAPGL